MVDLIGNCQNLVIFDSITRLGDDFTDEIGSWVSYLGGMSAMTTAYLERKHEAVARTLYMRWP